jgi:putative addiction module killer protein
VYPRTIPFRRTNERGGALAAAVVILYPTGYDWRVIEIRQTEVYAQWFSGLRDRMARARIDARIRRLSLGNLGDVKPVGEGVSELRIDYGPGYRVYFVQRGQTLVFLLAGGDKRTQERDIVTALDLAREL